MFVAFLVLLTIKVILLSNYLNGKLIVSMSHFEAFREILERKSSAHPFENVQSLLPPNSWLGLYPVPGKI